MMRGGRSNGLRRRSDRVQSVSQSNNVYIQQPQIMLISNSLVRNHKDYNINLSSLTDAHEEKCRSPEVTIETEPLMVSLKIKGG